MEEASRMDDEQRRSLEDALGIMRGVLDDARQVCIAIPPVDVLANICHLRATRPSLLLASYRRDTTDPFAFWSPPVQPEQPWAACIH